MTAAHHRARTGWRRTPATTWRAVGGRLLILPPRSDEPVEVTGPGLALWHVLEEPTTLPETVAVLADAFGVAGSRVEADLVPVLERLAELGAVEHVR